MLLLLALSFGALALTHAEDDATEAMVRRLVFAFKDKKGKVCMRLQVAQPPKPITFLSIKQLGGSRVHSHSI